MDNDERDILLKTEAFKALQDLKDFDEEFWQKVDHASGNIPRDLKKFSEQLVDEGRVGKHNQPSLEEGSEDQEPVRKRQKMTDLITAGRR